MFDSARSGVVKVGAVAGLTALALAAVAAPAQAAPGWPGGPSRAGAAAGQCSGCTTPGPVGVGELTAAQQEALQFWVEEEKLAHDLYVALGAEFPELTQFDRVARSETHHQSQVAGLLESAGLPAPGAGLPEGQFENPELAALYRDLYASGSVSPEAALAAGRAVEEQDLTDLAEVVALFGGDGGKVVSTAESQIAASERHLKAFGG